MMAEKGQTRNVRVQFCYACSGQGFKREVLFPEMPTALSLYDAQEWPIAQYVNVVCQSCYGTRYEGHE